MKIEFNKIKQQFRIFHRILAPIVFLPLFMTVITGIAYRLGRNWFGLSKDQTHFLMVIHEGGFLGNQIKPFYVLLDGIALIWMLITGIIISDLFRKKIKKKPKQNTESKVILTESEN
ncbi:MAG: PepSY domain-containing protein [Cyanobacteria bacterium P01_H01_bin.35]